MEKLNKTELVIKFMGIKSSFVGLKTETAQSTLNKGRGKNSMVESLGINPDEIVKHTKLVALIGTNVTYQDMVNNRLAKENADSQLNVTFESADLPFGEWVNGAEKLLIKNGDKLYLRVYCVANNKPTVEHIYNGSSINLMESKFDSYRKPDKKDGENQGLEKPIVVRTYGLDSIKEITIGGMTYEIV